MLGCFLLVCSSGAALCSHDTRIRKLSRNSANLANSANSAILKPAVTTVSHTSVQDPLAAQRLRRMHDRLAAAYGPQHWWPAKTRFEVILGAYLTQNTAWKAVERSLANLRAADALTVNGLRKLPLEELARCIRPSGFVTRKAPALKAFVCLLDEEFSGSLDKFAAGSTAVLRARLLELPNVGPETADAILLYALGHPVPVADEYLRRVITRHRLLVPAPGHNRAAYESMAELTRQAFASDAPKKRTRLFNEFHALTVAVGKAHCRRTAYCADCPLAKDLEMLLIRQ